MRVVRVLGVAAVFMAVSCATNVKKASLNKAQLGTKYAKQTGYFAACGTMCIEEQTKGSIRHEVIRDEATLASVGSGETCFDLVIRTSSTHDEPIDQLEPACILDGAEARAVVDTETVTVRDYNYTGQVETIRAEAVTQQAFLDFSLTEPQEMIFRVIERDVRLCCGSEASREVRLRMANPNLRVGASRSLLDFSWQMQ